MTIRFGKPLDFSRYAGHGGREAVLRAVTDEIMYAILQLSGQEYVDLYAAEVKARGQGGSAPVRRQARGQQQG